MYRHFSEISFPNASRSQQVLVDSPRKHLAWPHSHTHQSRERTAIVTPSGPMTLEELLHRTEPAPSLLSLAAQDPVVVAQTPDIVAALLCHITLLRAGLCAVFVDGEGKEAASRACRKTGANVVVLPGEDDTVGWGGLLADANVTVLAGGEIVATSRERVRVFLVLVLGYSAPFDQSAFRGEGEERCSARPDTLFR
jgi:hypothetical protein